MVEFSCQICAFLVKKEMVETAVSAGHGVQLETVLLQIPSQSCRTNDIYE